MTSSPEPVLDGSGEDRGQDRLRYARIAFDSMAQFVGLLDAQGTVLEINKVALDGIGLELKDVAGQPFWKTFWWQVSPEITETLRLAVLRAAAGEFVRWDAEIYGRASGAETIIIDASLSPVKDEHGVVVFICAEGRDITQKKAHEREIARQREELAQLDVAKTRFFANVSHEFRTPLTLMLGPLDEALNDTQDPLGDPQRERLAMVQRNCLRLQKLVNSLLDFSRVQAGRSQALYNAVDLADVTRDLASSFRSICEKAGLYLEVDARALPEPVFVDSEMWDKIVLNLISNAFKFTLVGGIKINVFADSGSAVVRFEDSGIGIAEDELPLIFDRFHRIEGSEGRSHEGSGIGLALVRELVKLHGGTVEVESVLCTGSTFTVRIPFGTAHLPPNSIAGDRTQASTATKTKAYVEEALQWLTEDGSATSECPVEGVQVAATKALRQRLLVADDNADMRAYLGKLLEDHWEVELVPDGQAALDAARARKPDLMLGDVMMPRLDGFELLRAIRADPELRDVPFIMLSARAGEEARIEGLAAGADGYIVKPFSARELIAEIGSNLKLERSRREAVHRQALLINELNHRVKNSLATVQSMAAQTFREGQNSAEARALFNSRLAALARAHDVLTNQSWEGAELADVVERALEPFQSATSRFVIEGSDVRLSPKQALALSMALHELATNAAKYGALSNGDGRVRIAWSIAPRDGPSEMRLTWTEEGGPLVSPPSRKGFGSRLIERSLAHDLGGEASIEYRPEGVVSIIRSPIEIGGGWLL